MYPTQLRNKILRKICFNCRSASKYTLTSCRVCKSTKLRVTKGKKIA